MAATARVAQSQTEWQTAGGAVRRLIPEALEHGVEIYGDVFRAGATWVNLRRRAFAVARPTASRR